MTEPTELMRKFWNNQRLRGETPGPIYAAVSKGGDQPVGYVIGWSLHRRWVKRRLLKEGHDLANWTIERIEP